MSLMPNENLRLRSDYPGDNQTIEIESLREQVAGLTALCIRLANAQESISSKVEYNHMAAKLAEALSVRENCTLVPTHELKKLHEQLAASQLREQQLGRQPSVGDVAEDVHQHAAHADHQQDDQGSQETLDEIAQQVSVELQHGAVV